MSFLVTHDQVAAQLYLRAVLPAFQELAEVSARARALVANWECAVEFAVFGYGGATVSIQQGRISVLPERCGQAAISLFFISARQLVKQFDGEGLSLPLPRRGLLRLPSLLRFQRLGKILEEELEQHPRLMLGVALGSLQPLIEQDRAARHLMQDCPTGLAEFALPASDLFAWAEWRNGAVTWGRGRAPRRADVSVSFRNEATALAALRGELDEQAAIGVGDLSLRGLVPLAETMGLVMARADIYVKRRTKTPTTPDRNGLK